MTQRRISGFLLLLIMLFSLAAYAQNARQVTGEKFVARDAQGRPIADLASPQGNPQLSAQDQEWVDQQIYQIRRDLVKDAVNRMRDGSNYNPRSRSAINEVLNFTGPFLVFLVITGFVLWFIRTLLQNRRWDKMAKIQTDAHTKLLDKLGTSPELVAYLESDAGKRFLEATPFEIERGPRPSFPFTRILWSAQAGVVVLLLGVGLLWLSGRFTEEDARGFLAFGTLSLAVGVGFLLSAGVSYVLSKRFGLLNGESKPELLAQRPQ